jgi:hypothetical protein
MTIPYLLLVMLIGTGVQSSASPAQVVRAFYRTHEALSGSGLPDSSARTSIAPFISPRLEKLLQQAKAKEARCIESTQAGLKPPIWESAIFAGTTEGATGVSRIVVKTQSSKSALVSASLEHIDSRFAVGHKYHTSAWLIDLRLSNTSGRWLITDLSYSDGVSLSKQLVEFIQLRCDR